MYQLNGKKIAVHPAAELFPLIEGAEFAELVEDIREHGQHESIVVWRDQVIDGRNRLRACEAAGREPRFTVLGDDDFGSDGETADFVVSQNLRRRHLSASQRAMIAAKLVDHYEPEAREQSKTNLKQNTDPVSLPGRKKGDSRDKAAAKLSVSGKSVSDAKKVLDEGSEKLTEAVEKGDVSVSKAAKVVRSEPDKTKQLEKAKPDGRKKAAKTTKPAAEEHADDTIDDAELIAAGAKVHPYFAEVIGHLNKARIAAGKNRKVEGDFALFAKAFRKKVLPEIESLIIRVERYIPSKPCGECEGTGEVLGGPQGMVACQRCLGCGVECESQFTLPDPSKTEKQRMWEERDRRHNLEREGDPFDFSTPDEQAPSPTEPEPQEIPAGEQATFAFDGSPAYD